MKIRRAVAGSIIAVVVVGVIAAGAALAVSLWTPPSHLYVSVSQSHVITAAHHADEQLMRSTARGAVTSEQEIAAAKLAAEQAAAVALAAQQAAAAQAAQLAAQQAAARQASAQQTTTQAAATASAPAQILYHGPQQWTGALSASGTPLPLIKDDDPNSGQYGQMVIEYDPGSYCSAHSGTTRNGVPECT